MNKLCTFSLAVLYCSTSYAAAAWYLAPEISLEIENKAHRPIWVAVLNDDSLFQPVLIKGLKKLSPEISSISLKLDITQPTKIAVWHKDPGKVSYGRIGVAGLIGEEIFSPIPSRCYSFTPGKTIYLLWDSADFPRPQTGHLGGLSSITHSGLNLHNNVQHKDIRKEPATYRITKKGIRAFL